MTSTSQLAQKQSLRREFKMRHKEMLPHSEVDQCSAQIRFHLQKWISQFVHKHSTADTPFRMGLFRALVGEPDLFHQDLISLGMCYWPEVQGEGLQWRLAADSKDFELGAYGILEPKCHLQELENLNDLNVIVVPGLAFDRNGMRLGRGAGYYDRALNGYKGTKIGVGFHFQIIEEDLPHEPHDVAMDWIMTERFILQPKGKAS